ncbi:MAG: ATP-grasp domain-containing protein [Bdellovibrionaceae bacterium]|nr:ATP-grasp domain-containing protein [Pseudobdellovibrionaceae bacterium]
MKAILLFGGKSDERLVSAASAQNLSRRFAFDEHWYLHVGGAVSRVSREELDRHEKPFTEEFRPKEAAFAPSLKAAIPEIQGRVIFLGMHGTEGEDGQIQRLFEDHKIGFTGSGAASSASCFDKAKTKAIANAAGLPGAAEKILKSSERSQWKDQIQAFAKAHPKLVLKPTESGSSFGLQIVRDPGALGAAIDAVLSSSYGDYLMESFIEGRELTVGVLQRPAGGGKLTPLPASEVVLNEGFSFDYQGKYLGRGTTEITPAQILPAEMKQAQDLAVKAHEALKCTGYSRTDMILTKSGPIFLETNTLPGLSKASFIPQQLEAAGIAVTDFVNEQIEIAAKRY